MCSSKINRETILNKLGLSNHPIDMALLQQAFTHRSSHLNKLWRHLPHNERLEYLGDAILKSSISDWLYRHFPDYSEGQMSTIRSYVVSDAALAQAASRIGLSEHIILSRSEKASGGLKRESILANVFEAVCGAVFLSSNYPTTAHMLTCLLEPELKAALKGKSQEVMNYKALLQEYTQAEHKCLPIYQVIETDGPQHNRVFKVQVTLNDQVLGMGEGRSKKKAEQVGARVVLEHFKQLPEENESQDDQKCMLSFSKEEVNPRKMKTRYLAPSILSANFASLGEAIQQLESGGADWLHMDVMDGHFVPNLTIGPPVIQALRPLTSLPFDAHLMIEHPERWIDAFVEAGCDRITVHAEACLHLDRVLSQIQEANVLPGVALNPATPIQVIENILHKVKLVLLMSVNPGFGGQKFIPNVIKKIVQLKELIDEQGLTDILIQVDGGINRMTLDAVLQAGADVVVIGSAIFQTPNVGATTRHYQRQLNDSANQSKHTI